MCIGMLSLRNGLLQKSAFLRHNRCIELGKRYIKAPASAHVKQLSPEASSTIRALQRALVSVINTLLNDSERSLNKKWLRPVTNKSNPPIGWKSKRKHLSTFSWNCSISYIHSKKHTSSFRKANLKILCA